jgi:hypothetical protein
MCQPVSLAVDPANTTFINALAVDAANVYWATGPNLWKQSLSGGTPQSLVIGGSMASVGYIAIGGPNLYWTDPNRGLVLSMPVGGGTVTTLASGQYWPNALVVSGTNAYWTCPYSLQSPRTPPMGLGVFGVGLAGGTPSELAADWNVSADQGLAMAGDSLYWVDDVNSTGTLLSAPTSGGPTVTLESGLDGPMAVATSGSDLYMLMSDKSAVVARKPLAGGADVTLSSSPGQVAIGYLVADSTGAYWSACDGIWFVSPEGHRANLVPWQGASSCSATDLFTVPMALDAKFVYYASGQGVYRIAKLQ